MQIVSVRVRDSKFGQALVIETHPNSGGYMLGLCNVAPSLKHEVPALQICVSTWKHFCQLLKSAWQKKLDDTFTDRQAPSGTFLS